MKRKLRKVSQIKSLFFTNISEKEIRQIVRKESLKENKKRVIREKKKKTGEKISLKVS